MTTHNTASDAANTAVRAYLTSLGEQFLGHGFNTGSGKGKSIWTVIKKDDFESRCAYCGSDNTELGMEHLICFNRNDGGLHHPGNIVPCCKACNRRAKDQNKNEVDWKTHLNTIVVDRHGLSEDVAQQRKERIRNHILKYKYPQLTDDELAAIQTIAQAIYEGVGQEVRRGTELFWAIHKSIINKNRD